MSRTLTWEFLSPLNVNRALTAPDVAAVKKVFLEADAELGSPYFGAASEAQRNILLDLLYHVFRYSKSQNMTSEKISTLISVVFRTHADAMALKATMSDAYRIFETYIISHSVHRPPYSAAVFAVDDVKLINDYMLSSYFRHYKLYFFAFTSRSEARVSMSLLGDANEVPPAIPPLSKAIPLAQHEAHLSEARKKAEEEARQRQEERAAQLREEQRRAAEAAEPPMSQGLKKQLEEIRKSVGKTSAEKLDALEAKVIALEGRVAEASKPMSAQKAPARPVKK